MIDYCFNRSYYAYMLETTFKTPKELQITLGERVRRLRLARNADQRAAASKAGISERALRNLEAGRGSTVETLLRTLKALDAFPGRILVILGGKDKGSDYTVLQAPLRERASMKRTLASVGIRAFSFCRPSRGPTSVSLIRSL